MTNRISIHVDETASAQPKAVLVVCGIKMTLSAHDLDLLMDEVVWARNCVSLLQHKHFASPANQYRKNCNVDN
jgi:hypothetical protein